MNLLIPKIFRRFFVLSSIIFASACQSATFQVYGKTPTEALIVKHTVTSTSSFTLPETPTETITPFATVEGGFQDEQRYLDWLFSINQTPECKLPCWWGFVPGIATINSAQKIFEPLDYLEFDVEEPDMVGSGPLLKVNGNNFGVYYSDFRFKDKILLTLKVGFSRSAMDARGLDFIKDEYFLQPILLEYGSPSEIFVRGLFPFERDTRWGVELWLIYPNHGFIIVYDSHANLPSEWNLANPEINLEVCINDATLDGIEIYLEANNAQDFLNIVDFYERPMHESDNPIDALDGIARKWEDSTGLTITDFVILYKDTGEGCFVTLADSWKADQY